VITKKKKKTQNRRTQTKKRREKKRSAPPRMPRQEKFCSKRRHTGRPKITKKPERGINVKGTFFVPLKKHPAPGGAGEGVLHMIKKKEQKRQNVG